MFGPKKKSPDPTTTSILWLPPKRRWCRFEWVQKSSQLPMDGRGSHPVIDEGQTSENMGSIYPPGNISKSWEKGNHRLKNGLVGDILVPWRVLLRESANHLPKSLKLYQPFQPHGSSIGNTSSECFMFPAIVLFHNRLSSKFLEPQNEHLKCCKTLDFTSISKYCWWKKSRTTWDGAKTL